MPIFILNIPNTITIFRFLMIPMACIPLLPIFGAHSFNTLLMTSFFFIFAASTDFLDGYFARKLNQMTEWGAYMDPLVDKFLIWGLYLVFIFIPDLKIPAWSFIIILLRDFLVTQMRNYALHYNISFKTSFLAKIKTAGQMIIGGFVLLFLLVSYHLNSIANIPQENYLTYWQNNYYLANLPSFLVILVTIFTGITGVDYAYALYRQIKSNHKKHPKK